MVISKETAFTEAKGTGSHSLASLLNEPTVLFSSPWVKKLTLELLRAIRTLFLSFGVNLKEIRGEREAWRHTIKFMQSRTDGEAVKIVKYFCSVDLPALVKDVLPQRPEFLNSGERLLSGVYLRLHKSMVRGRGGNRSRGSKRPSKKALSYCFGLLQIKRRLPPLSKALKNEARKDHKRTLTKPAKTPSHLLAQIERTAKELFPLGWDSKLPIPSYSVTNKSCLESTRAAGGAQAYIFGSAQKDVLDFSEPDRMFGTDVECFMPVSRYIDQGEFLLKASREQPSILRSKVEIVEDPLKARVITKNNWQCTVLKPLQKLIHTRLRAHESFRLIGETISEEVINQIDLFPKSRYVSGDYSAATDNFHSDVTDVALDTILQNMTGPLSRIPEFMLLAKRSLTGLTIVSEIDGKECEFQMSRGQLMGSLLSFPILCLVNFAVWRHTTEQAYGLPCDGKGLGGRPDHVLINGDDIGFAATKSHYKLWYATTPLVGLSPSPGKNYYCREFITLNTRLYRPDRSGWLSQVKFLNQGLLKKAEKEDNQLLKLEALGKLHDDFVSGAYSKASMSGVFISENRHLLKNTWRNLFGPRQLGGLGAHPVSKTSYTYLQMKIARLMSTGRVSLPSVGESGRYALYERRMVTDRFKDCEWLTNEERITPLGATQEWMDVSPIADSLSGRFLSKVAWLAPYRPWERSSWAALNRLKSIGNLAKCSAMKEQNYLVDFPETTLNRLVSC